MRRMVLVFVISFAVTVLGTGIAQAAEGEIEGDLPAEGGVALVTWGGGDVDALQAAAEAGGCDLRSTWVFVGGRPVGYVGGAPAFVNGAFLDRYPGGDIPASTPLVLLCAEERAIGIAPVRFVEAFGGRTFDSAVELVPYPGGRFLVAEQDGRVLSLAADGGGERTFLDLEVGRDGSEEGLLSLALDPDFGQNSYVWAYYSAPSGSRRTVLSRFTVANGVASEASELVVLEVAQPYSNHNGGAIRFGPDGMLYLGLGDGGSGGDPQGHGQDTDTLLGSILRIDVRNATESRRYVVPPDNPFASGGGEGEIWAWGFRNPWRKAFDPATDMLWAGDVGQGAIEEIDVVRRGGNYGWNRLEGDQCYQSGCNSSDTVLPVATYSHDFGCSVTGGVVARDSGVPEVEGAYLFADYCSGIVWAMDAEDRGDPVEVGRVEGSPTSFATGPDGAVYLVQFGGPILRIASP